MKYSPEQGEEVEPGDSESEGPEFPLPGLPQPGVPAAAVHVHHHQDRRHVAEHVSQVVNLQIADPILERVFIDIIYPVISLNN